MRRVGSAIPTDADIMGGLGSFADGLGIDLDEAGRAIFPRSARYGDVATETGVKAPLLERVGAGIRDLSGIPYRAYQEATGVVQPAVEQFGRGMLGEIDNIGQEVAQAEAVASIVNDGPDAQEYNSMEGVNTVANPNLRRALEGAQAAPVADPVVEEVTVEEVVNEGTNSGSIGSEGFQARLDAVIARQNNPIEAISTFLRAMGEGETIGQGLQIAGKALDSLRRSNDAEQIALLKLLEAGSINERDYKLKQEQLKLERENVDNQRQRYESQADNEKERTRITEVYYNALSARNDQAATQALQELRSVYFDSIAIEEDIMGKMGYSQKQLDRLKANNFPEFNRLRTEALDNYTATITGSPSRARDAADSLDPATQAAFEQYQ